MVIHVGLEVNWAIPSLRNEDVLWLSSVCLTYWTRASTARRHRPRCLQRNISRKIPHGTEWFHYWSHPAPPHLHAERRDKRMDNHLLLNMIVTSKSLQNICKYNNGCTPCYLLMSLKPGKVSRLCKAGVQCAVTVPQSSCLVRSKVELGWHR